MTEDDTYRVLVRKPFEEVWEKWVKTILHLFSGEDITELEFNLEKDGWTWSELIEARSKENK